MTHHVEQHTHDPDPPHHNPHRPVFRKWTEGEYEQAAELFKAGHTRAHIAVVLKRTERQVRDKLYWEGLSDERRETIRARIYSWRRTKSGTPIPNRGSAKQAHPDAIADRDARLLAPRSLTAILMGDPPDGFSSLDRKLAGRAT